MLRSAKLGKIAGIDVYIHWSFWLLMILYVGLATLSSGLFSGLVIGLTFALVFACVLAHEFGHALAARAYGIPTHDITLLPIGGLARLARMPDKPVQELVIALAGPAVNVVIAMGLMTLLPLRALTELSNNPAIVLGDNLLENLLLANIVLVVFNMLPAFPMDGGRVLRSLIAMGSNHLRATEIAVRVGRLMAILFIAYGIFYAPMLVLIGIFIFLAGTGELMEARRRALAQDSPWFQFTWTTGSGPTWHSAGYPQAPGQEGSWPQPPNSQVIDATDVRHIGRNS